MEDVVELLRWRDVLSPGVPAVACRLDAEDQVAAHVLTLEAGEPSVAGGVRLRDAIAGTVPPG